MHTRSPRAASAAAVTATLFKQAEAHRDAAGGVVAGRADGEERGVALAAFERVDGREAGPGRAQRRRPRPGRDDRVGVEMTAALGTGSASTVSSIAGEWTRSSSARVASRGSSVTSASSTPAAAIPAADRLEAP